ncbi:MAG: thioredoxin domain-containing protein [Pseudomonadota bacterium]
MHLIIIAGLLVLAVIILLSKRKKPPAIATVDSEFEREISEETFSRMVVDTSHKTPVLVDFYANWCPPCHYLTPLLASMAKDCGGGFLLAKINTDENPNLKQEYKVSVIPTVMLVVDGQVVERFTGGKLEHSVRFTLAKHGIIVPAKGHSL